MTRETLSRLLGAVCFGFGMFQLGLSMMPDKVLKLIEFLGFHADRDRGLQALGKLLYLVLDMDIILWTENFIVHYNVKLYFKSQCSIFFLQPYILFFITDHKISKGGVLNYLRLQAMKIRTILREQVKRKFVGYCRLLVAYRLFAYNYVL